MEASGIELFSLLIDGGDITHPVESERDLSWIGEWIDVAGILGARCARVIAGKAPSSNSTMRQSRAGLQELANCAESYGVRVMTENWFPLLSTPEHVLALLDDLDGKVGLCLDFGNWKGEKKYEDFKAIAPYAESCHAKAFFDENENLDRDDYTSCLNLMRDAGFAGPYTLIYDGPGDEEWEGLAQEREILQPYITRTRD
jgi:sugar phosphate isomerase/epimerase